MGILHEDVCTFMIISRLVLLNMKNVLHEFEEKIKIEFCIQQIFRKCYRL